MTNNYPKWSNADREITRLVATYYHPRLIVPIERGMLPYERMVSEEFYKDIPNEYEDRVRFLVMKFCRNYISDRYPESTGDVERIVAEYEEANGIPLWKTLIDYLLTDISWEHNLKRFS